MSCWHTDFRLIALVFYLLPVVLCSHNQYKLELLVLTEKLAAIAVPVMLGYLILNTSWYLVRDLIAAVFQVESLARRVEYCRKNNPADEAQAMHYVWAKQHLHLLHVFLLYSCCLCLTAAIWLFIFNIFIVMIGSFLT